MRTTKRLTLVAMLGWLLCSSAWAGVSASNVWLYLPFDGSLNCSIPWNGFRSSTFFQSNSVPPIYVSGINGQALRITGTNGTACTVYPSAYQTAPTNQGSTMFWYRPDNTWAGQTYWWTYSQEGQYTAGGIFRYGSDKIFYFQAANDWNCGVMAPAWLQNSWATNWHHLIGTWDKNAGQCKLYVDGQRIGQWAWTNYTVLPEHFWYILFGGSGDSLMNGTMDDYAILNAAMDDQTASNLYTRGSQGLLGALGGAVLGSLGMPKNSPRQAYVRGEKPTMTLATYGLTGDTIRVTALAETNNPSVKIGDLPFGTTNWILDTAILRPGRYTLRLEAVSNGVSLATNNTITVSIRDRRMPDFVLGLAYAAGLPDATLRTLEDWHVSMAGSYVQTSGNALFQDVDRVFSYGLGMQYCMDLHIFNASGFGNYVPALVPAPYWDANAGTLTDAGTNACLIRYLYSDGSPWAYGRASPFSDTSRAAFKQKVQDLMTPLASHPGLYSIAFDDETSMWQGSVNGTNVYPDYSTAATNYFKQLTGLGCVLPPTNAYGTIFADNDPYLQWANVIGLGWDFSAAGLAMNDVEDSVVVHSNRPDVLTTTWSGGEHGECDAVMDYSYSTIWQPYPGYYQGHQLTDANLDWHRARQTANPPKPVWGCPGWWSQDLSPQQNWCVQDLRLDTLLSLAKGATLIEWFGPSTAMPTNSLGQPRMGDGIFSRDDLQNEAKAWADYIHQYGGMFARLQWRPSYRLAVLGSDADAAGMEHVASVESSFRMNYPALRVAGVPPDFITDAGITNGMLDRYEGLCLLGLHYSRTSVWNKVQQFAVTPGKKVFYDQYTDAPLRPAGAYALTVGPGGGTPDDTLTNYAAGVRTTVVPYMTPDPLQVSNSFYVAPFWLYGGDGRFLALVNYNMYSTQTVSVALSGVGGTVYDLATHQVAAAAGVGQPLSWDATISNADWKTYILLPMPIGTVNIGAGVAGGSFRVGISVCDATGATIKAPLPVYVQFFDQNGSEVVAYRTYTATDPGTGVAWVTIPRSMAMDSAGTWKVTVTEMVTGQTYNQQFPVPSRGLSFGLK